MQTFLLLPQLTHRSHASSTISAVGHHLPGRLYVMPPFHQVFVSREVLDSMTQMIEHGTSFQSSCHGLHLATLYSQQDVSSTVGAAYTWLTNPSAMQNSRRLPAEGTVCVWPITPSSQMRSVSCMGSPNPIDSSPPHTAHLFGSEVKEYKVCSLPMETQADSKRLAPHLRSSG